MKKILFIYTSYSTFVKTDYEILSSQHHVTQYQFKPVKGLWKTALQFLKQLFFLLFNVWKFDVLFIWFADYHSFLPVLFAKIANKKSFVVVGGYDVANIPSLKYGSLSSPLRRTLTLFTFKWATHCLPVVESLEEKLKAVSPKAKTKTIYTGYQSDGINQFQLSEKRDKIILTVSITDNQQRFLIKGLDRFKELAENLPSFRFHVIGVKKNAEALFGLLPQNLFLLPPLPPDELFAHYSAASFYAQLSRSEGLPNALCEGMLYGCIPIGTNIGGIPTAMGSLGLVLRQWNVDEAISYIQKTHNAANRETFKKQILEKFDLKFRIEKLINITSQ